MTTERDTKCAFCRKEVDPSAWCITFGHASVLGKDAVDQVCPECILDAFDELNQYREASRVLEAGIPPFEGGPLRSTLFRDRPERHDP